MASMFEQVPPRPGLVAGEHEVLQFWETGRVFETLRAQNSGKPRWSFLDGPITANGYMGVHHAWGRTLKDAFCRYFAMTGHDQRWQNGFDCQGLWVEVQVERELGFRSKRDIEEYGIEQFVQKCKERVWKYSDIQTLQSVRLGMWMDWPNSYFTMSDENNYTIWSFLKKCHERGFVYKGLDAMPWCPRCGTGISEQERKEGYKPVEDEAVYVKFPLKGHGGESLLIWTTTPWTLAANVAAAVNPDLAYLKVRRDEEVFYVAKARKHVLGSQREEVLSELKGSEMAGWEYHGPFDELNGAAAAAAAHRVVMWEEVSEDEGTGLVHIAPGCGKEDFDLGKENNLPVIGPIDDSGIYIEGFGELTGREALEAAPLINKSLASKGLLFATERYTHDYPHCWRCSTPLLFRAVDEWYIKMDWRDEIKAIAEQIRWIPDYGLDLELDWLRNMGDWMISKKRYWGLALPIYECKSCGWFDVVGGKEELRRRAVDGWEAFEGDPENPNSPHRPWIDAVKIACGQCGAAASRILDVGNPWLDAGIVPYSTTGYNADRNFWSKWIPADFVVESFPGQFRNWFYALLAMSTMMENITPFKTLLGYALVKDEHGEEMHYSKGNAIEFDAAADRMGADVMRWMYCRHTPTQNLNFGYGLGEQLERKVFGTLWNSYLFFCNYARLDEFDPSGEPIAVELRPVIDRWILSDLQLLTVSARRHFEEYWIAPFVRKAEEFIDQLSNWYIRRNRQRFWNPRGRDDRDKMAAYQTLYEVLVTLTRLLAPVVPFLSERMYGNLVVRGLGASAQPSSVHLCPFPEPKLEMVDETLSYRMQVAQQVTAAGRALREKAALRVRQPLRELRVVAGTEEQHQALVSLSGLISDELNVKKVEAAENIGDLTSLSARPKFGVLGPKHGSNVQAVAEAVRKLDEKQVRRLQFGQTISVKTAGGAIALAPEDAEVHVSTKKGWVVAETGNIQLALDTEMTPELKKEGLARDLIRHIQQLRKEVGLNIEDHIDCHWGTDDPELKQAIADFKDHIANETQAERLEEGLLGLSSAETVELEGGKTITLEITQRFSS